MKILSLSIDGNNFTPPSGMPTGGSDRLLTAIGNATNLIISLGVILALIYFIWGGLNWVTSGGDKQKINSARQKVIYSLIGIIVMCIGYFIFYVIRKVFHITI